MGLFDELKDLAGAAEKALQENPEQVKSAIGKLAEVVDQQTGGSHHDQIEKAQQKAAAYIEKQADSAEHRSS